MTEPSFLAELSLTQFQPVGQGRQTVSIIPIQQPARVALKTDINRKKSLNISQHALAT